MDPNALVGYSGFVGSHLVGFDPDQELFNSKNSAHARGQRFGHLIFSGARAEKWKAAQQPDEDQKHIEDLIKLLGTIEAERATLISTVDVYAEPYGHLEQVISPESHPHPYGKHRARLENEFLRHFRRSVVVRLPALFGRGLKKNIVFDFLTNNQTEKIDSRGQFQFYDLRWLRRDIARCWQIRESRGNNIFNLVTEPISAAEIQTLLLGEATKNHVIPQPARYDLRSQFDVDWGAKEGYLYDKGEVTSALRAFADDFRRRS